MPDPQPTPPKSESQSSPKQQVSLSSSESPKNKTPSSPKQPVSLSSSSKTASVSFSISKKGVRYKPNPIQQSQSSSASLSTSLSILPSTPTPSKPKPSNSSSSSSIYPSLSSSQSSIIDSLPDFEPIKFRVDSLESYFFYKLVVWMKSAHAFKDLRLPTLVKDMPPLGIHGFDPVFVSRGEDNKIIPGDHRRNPERFRDTGISVIKPGLHNQINIFWPSLHKYSDTHTFLRSQAWKHNTDPKMFPQDTDFIQQGLKIGMHLIKKITSWTESNFKYGDGRKHICSNYRELLHAYLEFQTDCRFQKLEYNETLYELQKIGSMGILSKMQLKQWKWNPVNIQVDKRFLRENEKPKKEDKFILEYLSQSIENRTRFFEEEMRISGCKRSLPGESSQPSKR